MAPQAGGTWQDLIPQRHHVPSALREHIEPGGIERLGMVAMAHIASFQLAAAFQPHTAAGYGPTAE